MNQDINIFCELLAKSDRKQRRSIIPGIYASIGLHKKIAFTIFCSECRKFPSRKNYFINYLLTQICVLTYKNVFFNRDTKSKRNG